MAKKSSARLPSEGK